MGLAAAYRDNVNPLAYTTRSGARMTTALTPKCPGMMALDNARQADRSHVWATLSRHP